MMKLFSLGLLLIISTTGALGQRPTSLEVFTSPDGAFRFVYPENYELLAGERILKATQGSGIPVCDFSTALVCVIYPLERPENTRFEAAGFSVDTVPGVTEEQDCLTYADRLAGLHGGPPQPSSFIINKRVYRHTSSRRTTDGHSQSSDVYITFQNERCYELRIAVSLTDESAAQERSAFNVPEDEAAHRARESLKLILSSVFFR